MRVASLAMWVGQLELSTRPHFGTLISSGMEWGGDGHQTRPPVRPPARPVMLRDSCLVTRPSCRIPYNRLPSAVVCARCRLTISRCLSLPLAGPRSSSATGNCKKPFLRVVCCPKSACLGLRGSSHARSGTYRLRNPPEIDDIESRRPDARISQIGTSLCFSASSLVAFLKRSSA
jgi:hypothetical protein